jgi:hypothetical protein
VILFHPTGAAMDQRQSKHDQQQWHDVIPERDTPLQSNDHWMRKVLRPTRVAMTRFDVAINPRERWCPKRKKHKPIDVRPTHMRCTPTVRAQYTTIHRAIQYCRETFPNVVTERFESTVLVGQVCNVLITSSDDAAVCQHG